MTLTLPLSAFCFATSYFASLALHSFPTRRSSDLLFFTGNYSLTIKIALMYIGLIIIRQMIEPKIFDNHFNMHPLGVLLIMFLSFKLWGLIALTTSPLFMIIIIASYTTALLHTVLTSITTKCFVFEN